MYEIFSKACIKPTFSREKQCKDVLYTLIKVALDFIKDIKIFVLLPILEEYFTEKCEKN